MKTFLNNFMLIVMLVFNSPKIKAQLISGDLFLKGDYMEVGIGPNGILGTKNAPPVGYHPNVFGSLGVVADPDKDGWTVSKPGRSSYVGDFTTPGTPVESWTILADGKYGIANNDSIFLGGLSGSNTSYSLTGGNYIAEWKGIFNGLLITQTISFNSIGLSMLFNVNIENATTMDINDVYYHRVTDPDNDQPWPGGNFVTKNIIEQQISDSSKFGVVSATGLAYDNAYFAIRVNDCRAKVYFLNSGLFPLIRIDSVYNKLGPASSYFTQTSDSLVADVGMGLVFKIGTIKAGESANISFDYAFMKNENAAKWNCNGKFYNDLDTVQLCYGDTAFLEITDTSISPWHWRSVALLSDSIGDKNKMLAIGLNHIYAFRESENFCGKINFDTLNIYINGITPLKPILDVSGNILSLPAGYKRYRWYNVVTGSLFGGKNSYTATTAGYYYAVIMDKNGCFYNSDTVFIDSAAAFIKSFSSKKQNAFYPNPTNGVLHSGQSIPLDITVTDISGRIVLQKKSITELDLSSFVDGMYFIHYNAEKNNVKGVQKVIKRGSE